MYRHGSISNGTIAAYVLYLVQLFDPIARFSEWLGEFRQGLAAVGKIVGLLQTPNAKVERGGAVELPAAERLRSTTSPSATRTSGRSFTASRLSSSRASTSRSSARPERASRVWRSC